MTKIKNNKRIINLYINVLNIDGSDNKTYLVSSYLLQSSGVGANLSQPSGKAETRGWNHNKKKKKENN
jgi:hypothetical protein